jgi:hypothetical protein
VHGHENDVVAFTRVCSDPLKRQVSRVESGERIEFCPVIPLKAARPSLDEASIAQIFERTIDMDRGDSDCIANLCLR